MKNTEFIAEIKKASQKYQEEFKCPYLSTAHVILALLHENDVNNNIAEYLKKCGVTAKSFTKLYIELIDYGPGAVKGECTPACDAVFDYAKSSASDYGIDVVSELIMLSILRRGDGAGMRLLEQVLSDKQLEDFESFLCDQINLLFVGVDLNNENDFVTFSTATKNKQEDFNCLIDLRKMVDEHHTIVVGFEKELEDLIKALLRYKKPSIILLGEPGVGKTALVEKFAIALNQGKVPPIMRNYRILQFSVNSALAGTKYRGELEEKMDKILKTVARSKNTILFIDEIHTIVGAGASNESTLDMSNILKPYLSRGDIKIIGATTNEEYETIKEDGALARRFKTMEILEPTKEQTFEILKAMKPVMLKHYGVKLTNKQLEDIYYKSTYRKGRMPDVALDELEEYCIDIYYDKYKKEVETE